MLTKLMYQNWSPDLITLRNELPKEIQVPILANLRKLRQRKTTQTISRCTNCGMRSSNNDGKDRTENSNIYHALLMLIATIFTWIMYFTWRLVRMRILSAGKGTRHTQTTFNFHWTHNNLTEIVQTQTRCSRKRCLIRLFPVCLQEFQLKMKSIFLKKTPGTPTFWKKKTHQMIRMGNSSRLLWVYFANINMFPSTSANR